MKRAALMLAVLAIAATLQATTAAAATSGTSNVTLAASAHAWVDILDPSLTITPSATDYDNDYVEATGVGGLRVRVKTNSANGLTLYVRCADASPQIALADLLVKTGTAPGSGGGSIASYQQVTAANLALWWSGVAVHGWQTVTTDVRVQNLINYDAGLSGTTNYTNTLTYTVVAQ